MVPAKFDLFRLKNACVYVAEYTVREKKTISSQINQYYYIENGAASNEKEYYIYTRTLTRFGSLSI